MSRRSAAPDRYLQPSHDQLYESRPLNEAPYDNDQDDENIEYAHDKHAPQATWSRSPGSGYNETHYTSPEHLMTYAGHGYGDDDDQDIEQDHDDTNDQYGAEDDYTPDDDDDDQLQAEAAPPPPPRHGSQYDIASCSPVTNRHHLPPPSPIYEPRSFAPPSPATRQYKYAPSTSSHLEVGSTYMPNTTGTLEHVSHYPSSPSPPTHRTEARPLPSAPTLEIPIRSSPPAVKRKTLSRREEKQRKQDALFEEVENAFLSATPMTYQDPGLATASSAIPSDRRQRASAHASDDDRSADGPVGSSPAYSDQHLTSQDQDDAEAEAGLAAMQAAEDEELYSRANSRRQSAQSRSSQMRPSSAYHRSPSQRDRLSYDAQDVFDDRQPASVDTGDLGGLSEPGGRERRASYDEGDELDMTAYTPVTPARDTLRPSASRPLPAPPPITTEGLDTRSEYATQSPFVPRSASMLQPSAPPTLSQPARARTDAEDRMKRQSRRPLPIDTLTPRSFHSTPLASPMDIDLPSLPTQRFSSARLGMVDFKKCKEPWSLGALHTWLLQITAPDQFIELTDAMVKQALVALFTNKVPTMNIPDAEVLSESVVDAMLEAGTLVLSEEWVKLAPGSMSGVLYQLTGTGCYAPLLHDNHVMSGRCYSRLCQRTLRKATLQLTDTPLEGWATYYHLEKEDVENIDRKEIEKQNILHEIVQTEHGYMQQLDVLRQIYRDSLMSSNPAIIAPPRRLNAFARDVFGKVDAIKKINADNLLAQLKYRQDEQGPWVKGYSDLFRQWIRKAKDTYIDYAAAFPGAVLTMRQEVERNLTFRAFLDEARNNKRSGKLGWDTYLKAPITRLQRYTLLLATVLKHTEESDEKQVLQTAIDEIKAVTMECDSRVAEMQRKVELADWSQKLELRPSMQKDVKLNLDHLGRELVHRGDLQRTGGNRFNWVDCHALLFDHYFVMAKAYTQVQKGSRVKVEKYDVSRLPIPMDLLVLDSTNDDAVMKSSYVRGLTSVSTVPAKSSSDFNWLGRSSSIAPSSPAPNKERIPLHHTSSAPPMIVSTITEAANAAKDSDKIVYPFKIKHLGREPYVLFAPTLASRTDWCNKIVEAKTKHAKSLYAQQAEPFGLRVIADSAFAFEYAATGTADSGVMIKGTPIHRALRETEALYRGAPVSSPVCRAKVNCATSFASPTTGQQMVVVGSDYGVYLCRADNPRGWQKALNMSKITQMAALEDFNILLLISNGALISYQLDVVCNLKQRDNKSDPSSIRTAPQKLSGSKDVNFFTASRMKDNRMLIIYKKRDGLSSSFKILEPILSRASIQRRGPSSTKLAKTDTFREYDDFSITSECSGINVFQNSIAVSTTKGFEVLTVEKKQSFAIPDLSRPEVSTISQHLDGQQALCMLRLPSSDQEFLIVYDACAVYVNKFGDVSRSVIMNFVCSRAKAAAMYKGYLVLFDTDFVEVRDAQNGRLKQIISGREVKCLDDGGAGSLSGSGGVSADTNAGNGYGYGGIGGYGVEGNRNASGLAGGRTVKFVMQHQEEPTVQLLLELLVDEAPRT